MSKEIKLFTEGVVANGEREFTRIMGGFGDGKPMFTIFQCADLLGLKSRDITRNFERNESKFDNKIDFIDLKSAVPEMDSDQSVDITSFLKEIGYSQNKLNATKKWLAFSFSGMMKLVKIATTKESWNIYDTFLEDYFKTKAENKVMKKTLIEEKEFLIKQKKFMLGSMFMEQDENKRMELFRENEKISERIKEIDVTLSNKELTKKNTRSIAR